MPGAYTEMHSVSLSQVQTEAMLKQAKKEQRNVSQLIRVALCEYLVRAGQLSTQEETEDEETE